MRRRRPLACLLGWHRWSWHSIRDEDDTVTWTVPTCTRCGDENPHLA